MNFANKLLVSIYGCGFIGAFSGYYINDGIPILPFIGMFIGSYIGYYIIIYCI